MNTTSHRRRSKVWLAFTPDGKNDENAICKICSHSVPRIPEDSEKCTTSKLWKHLNQVHMEVVKMLSEVDKEDIIREGLIDKWNLHALNKQSTTKGFTSKVWKYFTLDEVDRNIAICCECDARISRGTDRNTTSMWNHVKMRHPELYAQSKEDVDDDNIELSDEKAAVQNQFLLFNARHNSYICKTCGMIMKLDSPDEDINTSRLFKHLDNIFHKRVQHGLEQPKRPLTMYNTLKASEKSKQTPSKAPKTPDIPLRKKYPPCASPSTIAENREVDFVHSAVIVHAMYLQQKQDIGCDCTILIPSKTKKKQGGKAKSIPVHADNGSVKYYETESGKEFKVHSSVFSVASEKIKLMLDNTDSRTISMYDVKEDAMLRLIEIAYLGKLKNICKMDDWDIWDIYCIANSFKCTQVMKYLKQECPDVIIRFLPYEKSGKEGTESSPKIASANGVEKALGKPALVLEDNYETLSGSSDATPSGLTLFAASERRVFKGTSRRKRMPLSTQFRFQVAEKRVKEDLDDADSESYGNDGEDDDSNGNGDGSPVSTGPRFEIQGDTAILRASPDDDFAENGEVFDFLPDNDGSPS